MSERFRVKLSPYSAWADRLGTSLRAHRQRQSDQAYAIDGSTERRVREMFDYDVVRWLENNGIEAEFYSVVERSKDALRSITRMWNEAEFASEADALLFKMTWL